jgi:hypothetical protein
MTTCARPQIIKHNNASYYNAKELKVYDPAFFYGTSNGIRAIIKKKNIDQINIHYATFSKKFGWSSSVQTKPSANAQLLLLESWVLKNIPKMMLDSEESREENYEYLEAPGILHLDECEKFKDSDGNSVDIETRGGRTSKNIYFSAKDVARVFEMPNLIKIIRNKETKYNDDDYKTFTTQIVKDLDKIECKKQVFITYEGMIKILYSSQSKKAKTFRTWATDTLFTVQMGTEEKKEKLSADLIGQSVKNIRAVFRTCSKKVPCIYRFSLGTAKTLRKSMNLPDEIDDNFIIIKYGLTEDLDRRSSEHARDYEKIKGVNLGLMEFSYIDPKFLSEAEVDIKEYFQTNEISVKYEKYAELIAINPKHEKQIKKQFKYIGTEYQGSITDLITQVEKLNLRILALTEINDCKLKDKDRIIELKDKEIELKDKEIELKNKDIKYEQLRNEILEMKLNMKN